MLVIAVYAGLAASATVPWTPPGLRVLAEHHHMYVGAAVAVEPLRDDPQYREILAREYSILTPENVMKFELIHPEPDRYAFEAGDAIVDFAKQHNMRVRGHTLVWHQQLPKWVTQKTRPHDQWVALLHNHIATVVGHYRGRVYAWDVVNEAVADDGSLRNTIWLRNIGPEYLELAFRWAHEADPAAKLFYNDYGEENERKQKAIHRLVRDLVHKGVPINGVGLQMHMDLERHPRPSAVARAITRMRRLGLETHVTEMDVAVPEPFTEEKLGQQAELYRKMLRVCLKTKGCKAFLTWGFTDRHSWIPHFKPGYGAALPFDENYETKPAYRALRDELSRAR